MAYPTFYPLAPYIQIVYNNTGHLAPVKYMLGTVRSSLKITEQQKKNLRQYLHQKKKNCRRKEM